MLHLIWDPNVILKNFMTYFFLFASLSIVLGAVFSQVFADSSASVAEYFSANFSTAASVIIFLIRYKDVVFSNMKFEIEVLKIAPTSQNRP